MSTQILKAVLLGILGGALLFFMPFFLFRGLFFFLIIFLIFRFWGFRRRWYGGNYDHYFWNPSYTQRWRNMTDEERKAFTEKMEMELFKESKGTNS